MAPQQLEDRLIGLENHGAACGLTKAGCIAESVHT
jgi:hypothetical protein